MIGGALVIAWIAALHYAIVCRYWPRAKCLGCHGTGKKFSPSGASWRNDKWCGGSGQRRRVGVMVYHAVRGTGGYLERRLRRSEGHKS